MSSAASLQSVLKQAGGKLWTAQQRSASGNVLSSGCPELDAWLPAGGFRQGTFVEFLHQQAGSGATSLALHIGWQACQAAQVRQAGKMVIVDSRGEFYPPALPPEISPQQILVVRPQHSRDAHWAIWQAFRCAAVAAVVCWPQQIEEQELRRLQLAAEASKVLGLLIRPLHCRSEPSWGDLRLHVSPRPVRRFAHQRQVQLELLYARGALPKDRIAVELHHETHSLRVVPPLAVAASAGRTSRTTRQVRRAV